MNRYSVFLCSRRGSTLPIFGVLPNNAVELRILLRTVSAYETPCSSLMYLILRSSWDEALLLQITLTILWISLQLQLELESRHSVPVAQKFQYLQEEKVVCKRPLKLIQELFDLRFESSDLLALFSY